MKVLNITRLRRKKLIILFYDDIEEKKESFDKIFI